MFTLSSLAKRIPRNYIPQGLTYDRSIVVYLLYEGYEYEPIWFSRILLITNSVVRKRSVNYMRKCVR